jgi:mono/diheme cytochrome c family protein
MHTKSLPLFLLLLALLIVGCGGAAAPTSTPRPTFTPIPTFDFSQPTAPPSVATAAATTGANEGEAVAALNPEAVERGRGRYEALECAACHGDAGEGTDDGPSLITSTQSEADFISFMRSGGELGAEHQYSTNRLSDSGGRNLYQYLLSLREG